MSSSRYTELPEAAPAARERERASALAAGALMVLAVGLLAAPVAWNGFAFIYHDSIDYLGLTFTWQMPEFRTAAYGLFAGIGHLAGNPTAIVLAQSALVVAIIALCVRAQFPQARFPAAFAVTMMAALCGGISLFASQIMADVFAGAAVLGLCSLMLFADGLSPWRRYILALACAVAVAVHTSHVGTAVGLLGLGLAARLVHRRWPAVPPVRLREALLCVCAAIAFAVAGNAYVTGRPFLTQPATVQSLGMFVEGGVAKAYLDHHCADASEYGEQAPFRLCAYRNALPRTANEFLWNRITSPLYALGGWNAVRGEAEAVVDGALETMPGAVARQALDLTLAQLFMLDPGDGLEPRSPYYLQHIGAWYPHDARAFQNSRQQRGIDFSLLNWPTRAVMGSSLAVLLVFMLAARRAPRQALFAGAILAAVLGNAFICGALSNPNHRYQGRMVWLVASAAVMLIFSGTTSGRPARRETAPQPGSV
ncbi:hypothetical protein ACI7BZ_19815 [Xanthobacter sp. AM11]|uniref:hypothetical protein n=1 Tax=Xanthobacter sp. AM11 TaxID=3380643 RepID=UPI0039BED809